MKKGLICLLAAWLLLVPVAFADEGPTQDDVNAVARRLFCPVCENTPLDVCPTEACQQWRDVIRTKLIEGQSEEEIMEYFANMYGDSVLAEPPPRQVAAWLFPVVIVLVAVAALALWLRSWTRPDLAAVAKVVGELPQETDPYVEQLEQELSEWES
jgi:cytochrome c-type biogenesis protein CcmH